jgi:hypothetical protein
MGLFERFFGRKRREERRYDGPRAPYQSAYAQPDSGEPYQAPEPSRQDGRALPHAVEGAPPAPRTLTDEQAIARYRYMLRTAPPEVIEQAHEEAFARLTPQQRAMMLRELAQTMTPGERTRLAASQDDPRALARLATRAEIRRPGVLERLFGGMGPGYGPGYGYAPGYGPGYAGMYGGMGMGSVLGGSLLASIAGGFIGSMIADEFFEHMDHRDFDDSDAAGVDSSMMNDPMGAGQPMEWQSPGDPYGGDANAPADPGDPDLYADPGAFDPGADYAPDPSMDAGSDFGGDFGGDGGVF